MSAGKVSDRSLSFIGQEADRCGEVTVKDQAIIVVDPFSTGALMAKQCYEAGYKVIQMFSIWNSPVASLVELVRRVRTVHYSFTEVNNCVGISTIRVWWWSTQPACSSMT